MTELGRALKRIGHEVVICCLAFDAETAFADRNEFEILAVHEEMLPPPSSLRDAQRTARRDMPAVAALVPSDVDVINAHEMPAHIAGMHAAKLTGKPWVWTRNDFSYYEYLLMPEETMLPPPGGLARTLGRMLNSADHRAGQSADAVAVLDTRNARMVERAYGREATIVRSGPAMKFFDPPDRAAARAQLGVADDEFLALCFGILMPYRRFEDVIEAVCSIDDRRLRARIMGSPHLSPAYAEELRELVDGRAVEDRVELIFESIDDATLRASYAAADVFIFPNDKQTWGLAPLEALASGTPAIVSRGAGVHEVLEQFDAVQLVDPQAPDQIAAALKHSLSAPAPDLAPVQAWIRDTLSGDHFAVNMAELMESLRG